MAGKSKETSQPAARRQHGVKGVYYGGTWVDIEDCDGAFTNLSAAACSGCDYEGPCPRSRSRHVRSTADGVYDVIVIGAGCIGSAIARELSRYTTTVLLVDSADDVTQGATKGNSGIVHAGYDDKPGTNRAKFCWTGNQMFPALDRELRFGYQTNGSLVVAFNEKEKKMLTELKKRGETNGVKRLRIITDKTELFEMEPALNPQAVAALYAPDAGNVIPYEFTIALAENAVDNGVEVRIRREAQAISFDDTAKLFQVKLAHWEPTEYYFAAAKTGKGTIYKAGMQFIGFLVFVHYLACRAGMVPPVNPPGLHLIAMAVVYASTKLDFVFFGMGSVPATKSTPLSTLVSKAGPVNSTGGTRVDVDQMMYGGSGSSAGMNGKLVDVETLKCRYVINCAGCASDKVAAMIGDESFKIKPRVGDYILLNRNQGHLAKHTIFPTPDPVLGKGVLVQTTLWGNLILGPTARDMHKPEARDMSTEDVEKYILRKCKQLVPSFDPKETIHAFCGARAKSDRGDWIIEPSKKNGKFIHVAGIDSPGLAGAPAIALEVVRLLGKAGLKVTKDPNFKPNRAPIITPKDGMKGLKMGPVGKYDSDGSNTAEMAANVICKCEKVTELEVVRALRRSLPIDSSQGIRKRTRAGMGHCAGDPDNFNCEARVRAIIARENGIAIDQVGRRPWPATSLLSQRFIDEKEKQDLDDRMNKKK